MSRAVLLDPGPAREATGVGRGDSASPDRDRAPSFDSRLAPHEPAQGSGRREERPRHGDERSSAGAGGGRLALGDVVAGAWEGLLAAGSAPCPVCGDLMERRGAAGHCRGCGSKLS